MDRYYRRRFGMKLRRWLLYHQKEIVFDKCRWMGVPAMKNPFDAWIYQEIIHNVRPDVIVEIGSAEGGSTLYFAHLLDLLGKGCVVSVDVDRSRYAVRHPRIIVVTGDSSSPEVFDAVRRQCAGKTVLVVHDGDHHKEQVLKDLEQYAPLVTINSYFIVEDGLIDLFRPGDGMGVWFPGPLAAVQEFVRCRPDFVVDTECERYILTYNPRGYLKKVR